jgi:uncharacterized protein YndB with AHSA1/START domain
VTTTHVYQVYLRATPEQVWQAITDPAFTRRYFHRTAIESTFEPGAPVRYLDASDSGSGAEMVDGTVELSEPPHRLVHTWRFLYDPAMAAEPPSRVEWRIDAAGAGLVRLRVEHGDLGRSPLTWAHVKDGWVWILDSLKSTVETGEPLPDETIVIEDISSDPSGDWHRAQGIECNNATWALLERGDRSPEDDEDMLRTVYASAYHWARAARRTPANEARALYAQSKVWRALGHGPLALDYADRCLAATLAAGLEDFDLAYAHEAQARALQLLGRDDDAAAAFAAAVAVPIADPEDLAIVEADLGEWP